MIVLQLEFRITVVQLTFTLIATVEIMPQFSFRVTPVVCFIQLDKSVITGIAMGDESMRNRSLIKVWCDSMVMSTPHLPFTPDIFIYSTHSSFTAFNPSLLSIFTLSVLFVLIYLFSPCSPYFLHILLIYSIYYSHLPNNVLFSSFLICFNPTFYLLIYNFLNRFI